MTLSVMALSISVVSSNYITVVLVIFSDSEHQDYFLLSSLLFTLGLRSFSEKVEMVSVRMSRPARENPWMIQPWRRTKIEKRKGKTKRSGSIAIDKS